MSILLNGLLSGSCGAATDVFRRIASVTLTGNTTQVDFTGLDGDTDNEYILKTQIVQGLAPSAVNVCGIVFNDDTVATNYPYLASSLFGTNRVSYGTGVRANGLITNWSSIPSVYKIAEARIVARRKTGIYRQSTAISVGAAWSEYLFYSFQWLNTTDNITKISIVNDEANLMGAGTIIELYARR